MIKQIKFLTVASLLFATQILSAQTGSGGSSCPSGTFCNPFTTITSFSGFVNALLDIAIAVGTPIIALVIIYSGFLFVTAQGNEEKLRTAKRALLWSIIGAAVLLGSKVIASAIDATISAL